MKLYGVVGDPIEHSLSPELFDYLFKATELPCRYDAFRISPDGLAGFVDQTRAIGIRGLNVTIPHKESIPSLLDDVADEAEQLGAVNTVVNRDGHLVGHNTDLAGFLSPLREHAVDLADQSVVVLGAGGAARAVAHGLRSLDVAHITLVNRTAARADALAEELSEAVDVSVRGLDDPRLSDAIAEARLLVNATSVGMRPDDDVSPVTDADMLHDRLIVYDLVYRPLTTRLLADAAYRGAATIDGVEMLIGQALRSFELWCPEASAISTSLVDELRGYLRAKLLDEGTAAK